MIASSVKGLYIVVSAISRFFSRFKSCCGFDSMPVGFFLVALPFPSGWHSLNVAASGRRRNLGGVLFEESLAEVWTELVPVVRMFPQVAVKELRESQLPKPLSGGQKRGLPSNVALR